VTISGNDALNITFTASEDGSIIIPNNPPAAVADFYITKQGEKELNVPGTAGVLVNDVDIDKDDILTAVLKTKPSHGQVNLTPDGSFIYTVNGVYTATDTFTYAANDGKDESNEVTVTITILDSNATLPPTAVSDTYSTDTNAVLVISAEKGLLVNDLPAGQVSGAVIDSSVPAAGCSVEINDDGSFTLEPDKDFAGVATFAYKITGAAESNTAVVSVLVTLPKVTLGSVVSVKPSEIKSLKDESFIKAPKVYGIVNGRKASFKKMKTGFTPKECKAAWGKKITLYDKKALKTSGYDSYFNSKGALKPLEVNVNVKMKASDKTKIDEPVKQVQLVPPVITSIQDTKGNVITAASAGQTIVIKGFFFGSKAPKVALEVSGKLLKCKVDKSGLKYADYKGKMGAMDPETGESSLTVILPVKKLANGTYPIVIDNKVGIATTPYIDENYKGKLPLIIIE
jgi:VCBS repeat-containing protein